MRVPVGFVRSRHLTRVAVIGLVAGLSAGCSSDTGRFADNPFTNPFAGRADTVSATPAPTRQVEQAALAPVRAVAAQPLAPIGSVDTQPITTVPATVSPQPMAQATQFAAPVVATASVPAAASNGIFRTARGYWSGDGGSVVTVGQNDNIHMIANRYGVPANAIMGVNGLTSPTLAPGQALTIPVFTVGEAPAALAPARATAEPPASKPVRVVEIAAPPKAAKPARVEAVAEAAPAKPSIAVAANGIHQVKPGETLTAIAQAYGTTRPKLAALNDLDEWANVRIGQKLKVPGGKPAATAKAEPAAKPKVVAEAKPAKPAKKPAETVAEAKPTKKPVETVAARETAPAKAAPKAVAQAEPEDDAPVETASTPARSTAVAAAEAEPKADAPATPAFRWPVKGRVISSYGQGADGLNISVPEGTAVKAAEEGVVAYAGNELKGYGNLVLIRHANGWVTAYAHAKDLNVKRGDTVRRGQVIATAGQTGDVNAPQLLFELRRGATPVDPRPYLSGT